MLLPLEPEVAAANPKFDALYRDLCTNKLNSDRTSRLDAQAQKERDALAEDLHKARVSAARSNLIKSHLQSLAYRDEELPSELKELIGIIATALSAHLSPDDLDLLHDDFELFKENIQPIANAISKAVAEDLKALTRIATLSGHPPSTSLPALLKTSQTIISNSTQHLSQLRLDLTTQTLTTQNLHRTLLEAAIRILEQTVHGSLSRGTKAKADYLATVAEGMARKLQVQEVQLAAQTTSPEYQAALERKAESLEREAMGLRRRVREAEELLGRYRRTEGMEEVAREYVEIVREREKVRADIERLEAGK